MRSLGAYHLAREGDAWVLSHADGTARLRDSRGLAYLARLAAVPGREIHVLDLVEASEEHIDADLGPMLDAAAKRSLRRRLAELDDAISDAERFADTSRAERARAERDAIVDELSRALGLGGRDRPTGSDAERARQSARQAIRRAIDRIGKHAPGLAEHLRASITTGYRCVYEPNGEVLLETAATADASRSGVESSLLGRAELVAELTGAIGGERLITLTGPGGCGKTTLAREIARACAASLRDGVVFVPLGDLAAGDPVAGAVTAALGSRADGADVDTPVRVLRKRHALLVLDNCEHVLDDAAEVARAVLDGAPRVTVLATSRHPLGLSAEAEHPVPHLMVPPAGETDPARIRSVPSVALFEQRARAIDPDFSLDGSAHDVATICRTLDGSPLGIELAASRLDTLDVPQILERLDRAGILRDVSGDRPERHRSMEAAVRWSYELLDARDRILFERLSVFVHPFTAGAAEAVCAWDGLTPDDVVDGLSRLLRGSLLTRTGSRIRMLETVRAAATAQLASSGAADQTNERLLRWVSDLVARAGSALEGIGAVATALGALQEELGSIRRGLRWAIGNGRTDTALEIATRLSRFWQHQGLIREGRAFLEDALAATPEPTFARGRALVASSRLARLSWEQEAARERAEEAHRLCLDLGDGAGSAYALQELSVISDREKDRTHAIELLLTAREAADRAGDVTCAAYALAHLGTVQRRVGRLDEAERSTREARATFRSLDHPLGVATTSGTLGAIEWDRGDAAAARVHFEESFAAYQELGDDRQTAQLAQNIAATLAAEGRHAEARSMLTFALAQAERLALGALETDVLNILGAVELASGDPALADRYHTRALELARELEQPIRMAYSLQGLGTCALARSEPLAALRYLRECLALQHARQDLKGSLETIGWIGVAEIRATDGHSGVTLLAAASALAERAGVTLLDAAELDTARTEGERLLGSDAFEAAVADGLRLDEEAAIARALTDDEPPDQR